MALELVHGKPDTHGFKVLDLSLSSWQQLLALGEVHGFKRPIPEQASGEPTNQAVDRFSGFFFWDQPAIISAKEAKQWAEALERALKVPELKDATLPKFLRSRKDGAEVALANANYSRFQGLSAEMVRSFISFLRKGAFQYAVWD